MGIGGNFWEVLKPCARSEGMDFLRGKRVAVDLSFWIIQHDAAVRSAASRRIPRKPHLRLTFFRTVNLFAKMGAFPVFVVDGEAPRLKAQARIERFCRAAGLDPSAFPTALPQANGEEAPEIKRNHFFTKYVEECAELLELMGMPVMRASGEAEALCARLNADGHVYACITADSDAFLFGARRVIKCLTSNSREPFECYNMSDIEASLGLKRKHLIAISLLVGNDYDLRGVAGVGIDSAVRLVRLYEEEEILQRLREMGKMGNSPLASSSARLPPHCERCGHPGSKRAHLASPCGLCGDSGKGNCSAKPPGFKCLCSPCEKARLSKEQKKQEHWRTRVCQKITAEHGFPDERIIEIYLNGGACQHSGDEALHLQWKKPQEEDLVDFLSLYLNWNPSYTRQRILPMLTTIFLREAVVSPVKGSLLCGQYEFHSIQRIKMRFFHPFYAVKWKRVPSSLTLTPPFDSPSLGSAESTDQMDEDDTPSVIIDDGSLFLLTDEDMGLVEAAFPGEVNRFLEEKERRESKSKRKKEEEEATESPRSSQTQLSITKFYRSTKAAATAACQQKQDEDRPAKSQMPLAFDRGLSKSVRRRLLFD